MKCYRVYYKNEILGTFANLIQAVALSDSFIEAGFTNIHIEIEKF